ncbi:ABC transporter permease [Actinomadura sp. LOL_016]|uniref:ABC transporter permease n=1 Tax=unclassified Actinomadura TaxID=2626254 RepID=UPI003A808856
MTTDQTVPVLDRTPRARGRRRIPVLRSVIWAVALLVALFILYPLAEAVRGLTGTSTDTTANESTLIGVITSGETLRALLNTVILVVCGGVFAVVVGAALAWLNERTDARVGWIAEVLPLVSLFVPSLAAAIGWVFLLDPELGVFNVLLRQVLGPLGVHPAQGPLDIYSWYGLIWCYGVFLVPFAYVAISNGLQSLDRSVEEASHVAGASPFATFRRITLPSMRPALGGAGLMVVVMGMALFSMPVIIGTRAEIEVLPVLIVHDVRDTYPADEVSALSRSLLLLIIVFTALYLQRRLIGFGKGQAFATVGGKGGRSGTTRLGRWRWPARVLMIGYLLVSSVLPFLGLLLVSLQRFWDRSIDWGGLSLQGYSELLARPILRQGLTNSLVLGVICATIALACAVLVAQLTEVKGGRSARVVDAVLRIPAALPHMVFAIALIAAFGGPPFGWNGTPLILIAAYSVMYLPQGILYTNAAIQQIGRPLIEASQVSGAGEGRTLRRVLLPLMMPSVVSAWALVFVLMMGDITASAMLASTQTPVVGFVMLDQWGYGSYPAVAALGVVMSVVAAVVALLAMWVRGRYRING